MARISRDVFVPALTKTPLIQLQRCLRHRWDGISVVSDVSDAVRWCRLRHHIFGISAGASKTPMML
jgi:hypothetical protein